MNRLIPTPTPKNIEAALTAVRNGTSAIQQRQAGYLKAHDLWWVTIIFNERRRFPTGVGTSSAEGPAVGWITFVLPWWLCPDLSDEDYARVPPRA